MRQLTHGWTWRKLMGPEPIRAAAQLGQDRRSNPSLTIVSHEGPGIHALLRLDGATNRSRNAGTYRCGSHRAG
jgi:hypothetical protein